MTTDDMLMNLCQYGKPSLTRMANGWWCRVTMNTDSAGASIQIDSETNHTMPRMAVIECATRIDDFLAKVGAAVQRPSTVPTLKTEEI